MTRSKPMSYGHRVGWTYRGSRQFRVSLLGDAGDVFAGPVISYNVLALLAPATAAWTAFLLGRWVTASFYSAFVCGLLFGFSSYEIGQTIGHLHLTVLLAIPLVFLFVLRRVTGELSARRHVAYLTVVLSAQFLASTEIFLMLVSVGVMALVLGWWILEREKRPVVRTTAIEVSVARRDCIRCLAVPHPCVCAHRTRMGANAESIWRSGRHCELRSAASVDMARPPGGDEIAQRFTANPVESTAYLGVPLIAIIILFAVRRGRARGACAARRVAGNDRRFSLGPPPPPAGTTTGVGLGYALAHLPVTRSALPVRLTLFVALFAGLICAIWLAERPSSRLRPLAACAAVIAIAPTWSTSFWSAGVERSTFFSDGHAERVFEAGDTVLVLPYGRSGWSMLWQAESRFAYRMAGGRLGNLLLTSSVGFPSCGRWPAPW